MWSSEKKDSLTFEYDKAELSRTSIIHRDPAVFRKG